MRRDFPSFVEQKITVPRHDRLRSDGCNVIVVKRVPLMSLDIVVVVVVVVVVVHEARRRVVPARETSHMIHDAEQIET